jgi:ATP-binding cassette, subfamily B, bacterial PglK
MHEYINRILSLVSGKRTELLFFVFLFFVLSLIEVIGLGLIAPYIALVINTNDTIVNSDILLMLIDLFGMPREQRALLLILGFGLLFIFLIKTALTILINKKIIYYGQDQRRQLSLFLMKSYQSLPYTKYLNRNSSEYIHSINILTSHFSNLLILLLRTTSNGIVGLFIMGLLIWQNSLVFLLMVLIFGSALYGYDAFFKAEIHNYGVKNNQVSNQMLQAIRESMHGFKEIRVLKKEEYFFNIVNRSIDKQTLYNSKYEFIATIPRSLLELLMVLFIVLLVVVALQFNHDLQTLIPTLGLFGVAALRMFPFASILSNLLVELRHSHDSISRLSKDVCGLKKEQCIDKHNIEEKSFSTFKDIVFDKVNFRYDSATYSALEDISFRIRAGEFIGIIGASGSGKTTLIDVLLGFLNTNSGTMLYNGVAFSENLKQWRSQVSYTPQNIFLLDNSLANNIAWEDEDNIDEKRLMKSIKQARLSELVQQLPKGINTLLGENGSRISGGQRQRIALARAFYHNKDVIIMDEATSALDSKTESEIISEIKKLKKSRPLTLIAIAHNLDTLKLCDRIYKIEKGRIVDIDLHKDITTA